MEFGWRTRQDEAARRGTKPRCIRLSRRVSQELALGISMKLDRQLLLEGLGRIAKIFHQWVGINAEEIFAKYSVGKYLL